MHFTRWPSPLLAFCLLAAACGGTRSAREPARVARPERRVMPEPRAQREPSVRPADRSCPARTADTRVGTQNVKRGAALVFTRSDDVADLRERVRDLTLPIESEEVAPRLDNIHHGVRVIFEANDVADVVALRRTVRNDARRIAERCGLELAEPREPRAAPPPASPEHHSLTPSEKAKPKNPAESTSKKSETNAKKKDGVKAVPKTEPPQKPKDETKSPAQPVDRSKSIERIKPRVPNLPGHPPDPVLPNTESGTSKP